MDENRWSEWFKVLNLGPIWIMIVHRLGRNIEGVVDLSFQLDWLRQWKFVSIVYLLATIGPNLVFKIGICFLETPTYGELHISPFCVWFGTGTCFHCYVWLWTLVSSKFHVRDYSNLHCIPCKFDALILTFSPLCMIPGGWSQWDVVQIDL